MRRSLPRWIAVTIAACASVLPALAARAAPPTVPSKPFVRVTEAKRDAQLAVAGDDHETIIEVRSESGIGRATLERTGPRWPESLILRLHLKGLESLSLVRDEVRLEWSVPSSGEPQSRATRRTPEGVEQSIDSTHPDFASIRIVGAARQIPLKQGYFELRVPRKLLDGSPPTLRIQWIDFYRG